MQHIHRILKILRRGLVYPFLITLSLLSAGAVVAWSGPSSTPPNCTTGNPGCDAPINTSATPQTKNGSFSINSTGSTYFSISAPFSAQSAIGFNNQTNGADWVLYRVQGSRDFSLWNPTIGTVFTIGQAGTFSLNTKLSLNQNRLWLAADGDTNHYIEMNNAVAGNTLRIHELGTILLEAGNYVGVNTTNPQMKLDVKTGTNHIGFIDNGGTPTLTGSNDGFTQWSNIQLAPVGYVGLGTPTPNAKLDVVSGNGDGVVIGQVNGDDSTTIQSYINGQWSNRASYAGGCCNFLYINPDAGTTFIGDNSHTTYVRGPLSVSGSVTAGAFLYSSDKRLKTDIKPLIGSLADVLKLQGVTYQWIDPARGAGTQIGFIAQDVEKVVPELVHTDAETSLKSVDYPKVTALLVEALKEQQKEIDDLKAQVGELKAKQ